MDNELILIAERLWKYGNGKHYTIEGAQHLCDGSWSIVIKDAEQANQDKKEVKHDN